MSENLTIHLAQLNFIAGDLEGNTDKIIQSIKGSHSADVHVFSELCITGYPPNDLLLRPGFVEKQDEQIKRILDLKLDPNEVILLGVVTRNTGRGKPFHNSVIVIREGKIEHTYNKVLLPTYDVFDERRYFEPGTEVPPVFDVLGNPCSVLICEDCWGYDNKDYDEDPLVFFKDIRVNYLFSINASPAHVGKARERYGMFQRICETHLIDEIVYINQVGGMDDLVFDGGSFVVNRNGLVHTSRLYVEENKNYSLSKKIPLSYSSNETDIINHLVLGIRDYCKKNGFKKVVIGESGGIDSALTTYLAVKALGERNVIAVTMPSKLSSEGSVTDSEALCKNLGVKLFTLPIQSQVDTALKEYKESFGEDMSPLAKENLQSRIRGMMLMQYSNTEGTLLLTTGNKSEISVGYFTLYGDSNGGLAVLADVYKTKVNDISRFVNVDSGTEIIPWNIINKPPSAELAEDQVDSNSLPPYYELDAFLMLFLEGDNLKANDREALRAIIKNWSLEKLDKIATMVDRAEFKRQQLAPGIKLTSRAFGFGRNVPITQKTNEKYKTVLL